jgi:hypothetical protein
MRFVRPSLPRKGIGATVGVIKSTVKLHGAVAGLSFATTRVDDKQVNDNNALNVISAPRNNRTEPVLISLAPIWIRSSQQHNLHQHKRDVSLALSIAALQDSSAFLKLPKCQQVNLGS